MANPEISSQGSDSSEAARGLLDHHLVLGAPVGMGDRAADFIWRGSGGRTENLECAAGLRWDGRLFPPLRHGHAYLLLLRETICDRLLIADPLE